MKTFRPLENAETTMKPDYYFTHIARTHEPKIEQVVYEDLTNNVFGMAYKNPETGRYTISIDRRKISCLIMMMFVLYHELGHIVFYHLGYRHYMIKDSDKEDEVDWWAFEKIGLLNDEGQIKQEWQTCYECMRTRSLHCLRSKIR